MLIQCLALFIQMMMMRSFVQYRVLDCSSDPSIRLCDVLVNDEEHLRTQEAHPCWKDTCSGESFIQCRISMTELECLLSQLYEIRLVQQQLLNSSIYR